MQRIKVKCKETREAESEKVKEEGHCLWASTCHVCLAGPQGLKYQLQLPDRCCRLFSTGHVWLQDHFQKANSYQTRGRVSLTEFSNLISR